MGPNKKDSDKSAEEAFEKIAKLLYNENHIEIDKPCSFGICSKDFDKHTKQLKKVLKDIFWDDACNSF